MIIKKSYLNFLKKSQRLVFLIVKNYEKKTKLG